MKSILRKPETITALLLAIAFVISASRTPAFRDARYLLVDAAPQSMEIGIMALAMTFVIISGNIDLSVASGLGLICVCCARLYDEAHWPMLLLVFLAPLLGAILGLFNGVLITYLGLPSLVVTLGTLALYRGLAQGLLGDRSIGGFPAWFEHFDTRTVGTILSYPVILFMLLALLAALLLHKTVFGRYTYAIGTNEAAARFTGLPVNRTKLWIYILSGVTMGIGALMMMSRLGKARYDHAPGYELLVITTVVLGGTDIFGGRGSIVGTVLALFLLMIVQQGMILENISASTQLTVTGALLVVAVILANLTNKLGARTSAKPRTPTPTGGEPAHA
jgi:rhamnose transport system permease protein